MKMTEVKSSQIHAIGYDHSSNTLAIQFKGAKGPGSVYHYSNVPAKVHEDFIGAKSIGAYFGEHIKPHAKKYPYAKQGEKKA